MHQPGCHDQRETGGGNGREHGQNAGEPRNDDADAAESFQHAEHTDGQHRCAGADVPVGNVLLFAAEELAVAGQDERSSKQRLQDPECRVHESACWVVMNVIKVQSSDENDYCGSAV